MWAVSHEARRGDQELSRNQGAGGKALGVGKWIAGRDSLQREKPRERPTRGWGRREGGVVEMRVAAHFSQQTKTFAGISIWSHEAVFPSFPIIHHLSVLTTTWALPPPHTLSSTTHAHAHTLTFCFPPTLMAGNTWALSATSCNHTKYSQTHRMQCLSQTGQESLTRGCVIRKCKAGL